ncbi:MAG TPA: hypothetical protein PKB07_01795 [Flavilitoribacter sp.]|nr:hypothetical protein [Flavilitoribacter sp.]
MKNFDRIDRFLKNEMSEKERQSFLREMAADKELARETKLQQLEEAVLEDQAVLDLKKRIRSLQENPAPESPKGPSGKPRRFRIWPWLLVVVATIVIWQYMIHDPVDPGNFMQNQDTGEQPDPTPEDEKQEQPLNGEEKESETGKEINEIPDISRGRPQAFNDSPQFIYQGPDWPPKENIERGLSPEENLGLLKAIRAMEADSFILARNLARGVLKSDSTSLEAREVIAHASFLLKDYKTATAQFQVLVDSAVPNYVQEWEWYLLLSYAAQWPEQKANFTKYLNLILNDPEHDYHKALLRYYTGRQ